MSPTQMDVCDTCDDCVYYQSCHGTGDPQNTGNDLFSAWWRLSERQRLIFFAGGCAFMWCFSTLYQYFGK